MNLIVPNQTNKNLAVLNRSTSSDKPESWSSTLPWQCHYTLSAVKEMEEISSRKQFKRFRDKICDTLIEYIQHFVIDFTGTLNDFIRYEIVYHLGEVALENGTLIDMQGNLCESHGFGKNLFVIAKALDMPELKKICLYKSKLLDIATDLEIDLSQISANAYSIMPSYAPSDYILAADGFTLNRLRNYFNGSGMHRYSFERFKDLIDHRIDDVVVWYLSYPTENANDVEPPQLETLMRFAPTNPVTCVHLLQSMCLMVLNDVLAICSSVAQDCTEESALSLSIAKLKDQLDAKDRYIRAINSENEHLNDLLCEVGDVLEKSDIDYEIPMEIQNKMFAAKQEETDDDYQEKIREQLATIEKMQKRINSLELKNADLQIALDTANAEREKAENEIKAIRDGRKKNQPNQDKVNREIDPNGKYLFLLGEDLPVANKLRKEFPNSTISEDYVPMSGRKVDAVVCMTCSVDHSTCIPQKNECSAKGIPYIPCNKTNMEHIKARMAEVLLN